jgi:hypothetical protein
MEGERDWHGREEAASELTESEVLVLQARFTPRPRSSAKRYETSASQAYQSSLLTRAPKPPPAYVAGPNR